MPRMRRLGRRAGGTIILTLTFGLWLARRRRMGKVGWRDEGVDTSGLGFWLAVLLYNTNRQTGDIVEAKKVKNRRFHIIKIFIIHNLSLVHVTNSKFVCCYSKSLLSSIHFLIS